MHSILNCIYIKILLLLENYYLSGSFPNTSVAHINVNFGLLTDLHFHFCLFHLGHALWRGLQSHI